MNTTTVHLPIFAIELKNRFLILKELNATPVNCFYVIQKLICQFCHIHTRFRIVFRSNVVLCFLNHLGSDLKIIVTIIAYVKFSGLKEPPRIEKVRKICFQEITAKLNIFIHIMNRCITCPFRGWLRKCSIRSA